MIQSGIYVIKNILNGKVYVGSAINLKRRWVNQHRPYLRGNKHPNSHLQNAYNYYGENYFIFEVVEFVKSPECLLFREQYWLDHLKSYDSIHGYNLNSSARSGFGRAMSDGQKNKLANIRRGSKLSEKTKRKISESLKGENNPFFGKSHSEESKQKISDKNTGRKNSEHQKNRARETNTGKKISEYQLEIISKSNSMRFISDATRQKMREKKIGKKLSEETKQKMREARMKYLEQQK